MTEAERLRAAYEEQVRHNHEAARQHAEHIRLLTERLHGSEAQVEIDNVCIGILEAKVKHLQAVVDVAQRFDDALAEFGFEPAYMADSYQSLHDALTDDPR